jgi:hypothetical protein
VVVDIITTTAARMCICEMLKEDSILFRRLNRIYKDTIAEVWKKLRTRTQGLATLGEPLALVMD